MSESGVGGLVDVAHSGDTPLVPDPAGDVAKPTLSEGTASAGGGGAEVAGGDAAEASHGTGDAVEPIEVSSEGEEASAAPPSHNGPDTRSVTPVEERATERVTHAGAEPDAKPAVQAGESLRVASPKSSEPPEPVTPGRASPVRWSPETPPSSVSPVRPVAGVMSKAGLRALPSSDVQRQLLVPLKERRKVDGSVRPMASVTSIVTMRTTATSAANVEEVVTHLKREAATVKATMEASRMNREPTGRLPLLCSTALESTVMAELEAEEERRRAERRSDAEAAWNAWVAAKAKTNTSRSAPTDTAKSSQARSRADADAAYESWLAEKRAAKRREAALLGSVPCVKLDPVAREAKLREVQARARASRVKVAVQETRSLSPKDVKMRARAARRAKERAELGLFRVGINPLNVKILRSDEDIRNATDIWAGKIFVPHVSEEAVRRMVFMRNVATMPSMTPQHDEESAERTSGRHKSKDGKGKAQQQKEPSKGNRRRRRSESVSAGQDVGPGWNDSVAPVMSPVKPEAREDGGGKAKVRHRTRAPAVQRSPTKAPERQSSEALDYSVVDTLPTERPLTNMTPSPKHGNHDLETSFDVTPIPLSNSLYISGDESADRDAAKTGKPTRRKPHKTPPPLLALGTDEVRPLAAQSPTAIDPHFSDSVRDLHALGPSRSTPKKTSSSSRPRTKPPRGVARGPKSKSAGPASASSVSKTAVSEDAAAARIQSVVRGRRARKEVKVRRTETGKARAATSIQRVARGRRARKELRAEQDGAVALQRMYRGRSARRAVVTKRNVESAAATRIQSKMRSKTARDRFERVRVARSCVMDLSPTNRAAFVAGGSPPKPVALVVGALCVMTGRDAKWKPGSAFLRSSEFVDAVSTFRVSQLTDTAVKTLTKLVVENKMANEVVAFGNEVGIWVAKWIISVLSYRERLPREVWGPLWDWKNATRSE